MQEGTSGLATRKQNRFGPILQGWESFAGGGLFTELPLEAVGTPFQRLKGVSLERKRAPSLPSLK